MTNNKKPSRQEMIEAIYEKINPKQELFGFITYKTNYNLSENYGLSSKSLYFNFISFGEVKEIIIKNKNNLGKIKFIKSLFLLYKYWRKKQHSIEEQSDECIDFVYYLISE